MKVRNILAVALAAVLTFGVGYGAIAQSAPPPTPNLHSPADGAVFQEGETVKLVFYGVSGRHFVLLTGPNGTQEYSAGQYSYLNLTNLAPGTYTWQVQSRTDSAPGIWSSPRTFTVTGS